MIDEEGAFEEGRILADELFKVWECGLNLARWGCDYDGGYVVAEGLEYDLLLSGGIGTNVTFETDFRDKYPDVPIHMYDPTIKRFPAKAAHLLEAEVPALWHRKYIGRPIRKEISEEEQTFLLDHIEANDNIFLKMDIEGGEVPWIEALTSEQISKFRQIAIEFHNLKDRTLRCIKKIERTHLLVHLHGNNFGRVVTVDGVTIPRAYEMTFIRKSEAVNPSRKRGPLPIPGIDFPNHRKVADFDLNCYPFVEVSP